MAKPASGGEENQQSYTLYPNPNNGNLKQLQQISDTKAVELSVNSIVGQRICRQSVVFVGGAYQLRLPDNTAQGMYLLQIRDNSNHMYNLKFVVE